jgi:hypothetical protein
MMLFTAKCKPPEGLELTFKQIHDWNILGDTWRLAEEITAFTHRNDILFTSGTFSRKTTTNSTQPYCSVQPDEIAMLTANDFNLKTIQPLMITIFRAYAVTWRFRKFIKVR